jgi:hypothetical protein
LRSSVRGACATPASVSDCERIQNALAYNECLASFGPKVGERRPRVAAGGRGVYGAADAASGAVAGASPSRRAASIRGFEIAGAARPQKARPAARKPRRGVRRLAPKDSESSAFTRAPVPRQERAPENSARSAASVWKAPLSETRGNA